MPVAIPCLQSSIACCITHGMTKIVIQSLDTINLGLKLGLAPSDAFGATSPVNGGGI